MSNVQTQLVEYIKCYKDTAYALVTYNETFDKTKNGYVPFKLFPEQAKLISNYDKYRFNLVLKYRQAGISTVTAGYCAKKIIFSDSDNPEKILIIANKQDTSVEVLRKIKSFIMQYPKWCGIGKKRKDNTVDGALYFQKEAAGHIIIHNREHKVVGEVKAVATSLDALRGYTPTLLILDEAAYIEGGQQFWAACLASLGTGGKSIVISTPNGLDDLYYRLYAESLKGVNSFNIFELKWYDDPRFNKNLYFVKYDGNIVDWMSEVETKNSYEKLENILIDLPREKWDEYFQNGWYPVSSWFEEMCKELNFDKRMIAQELESSFLGSGDNVIDGRILKKQENENVIEPISKELERKLWVWKEPIKGHKYILGADISRGDSEDSSAFVIIDFDELEQVVEYHTKLPPDIFAEIVYKWGKRYNAFIVIDITGGMGVATSQKLKELQYPNDLLYYDNVKDEMKWKYGIYDDKVPGINYNSKRAQIIQALEEQVRGQFKIRSKRLISELRTFVYINGKPDHMRNHHDDIIQSLAIALYIAQNSFTKLKAAEARTKAMINAWVSVNNTQNSIPQTPNQKRHNVSDHMWLFSGLQ